nr:MAG TPA: hypothetical protein [Caudoviricetes sp.]
MKPAGGSMPFRFIENAFCVFRRIFISETIQS